MYQSNIFYFFFLQLNQQKALQKEYYSIPEKSAVTKYSHIRTFRLG